MHQVNIDMLLQIIGEQLVTIKIMEKQIVELTEKLKDKGESEIKE